MSNHSQKKWKYLSFALMGILATGTVGLFVPQASAHITNDTQHMLEHIYKFVRSIKTDTDLIPAIKAKTDTISPGTGGMKSVRTNIASINPDLGSIIVVDILPAVNGKTYSGWMTGEDSANGNDNSDIYCTHSGKSHKLVAAAISQDVFFNLGFACDRLAIQVFDDSGVSTGATFNVVTQYTETTDVTDQTS